MKKLVILTILMFILTVAIFPVYAGGSTGSGTVDFNEDFETDDSIDLLPITIPYFSQVVLNSKYNTILSWLSFAGIIMTVLIIAYWIFFILKAGVKAMRSENSSDGLKTAWSEIQSVFASMGISLAFPLILNLLGVAFGIGYMWDWPLAFRSCPGNPDYEYFYQAFAAAEDLGIETVEDAEAICF